MGTASAVAKSIDQLLRFLPQPVCGFCRQARVIEKPSRASRRVIAWIGSVLTGALFIVGAEQSALAACVGDCNGDNRVTINELIVGVNIVLDSSPLTSGEAFDADLSGGVAINDLITGVNGALGGCSATPSVTPTRDCTEDASEFVSVEVRSIQVLDRNSPCGIVAPTL